MEFLLTRRVKVSAQWSSEPLRRALARFDRDLEMTLNAGDLVPAGRIALVLARQLPPEQFIIDLQSADSMVIRAADDLAAVYALLHISRTALGILPLWFWNDQRFESGSWPPFPPNITRPGPPRWGCGAGALRAASCWKAGTPAHKT